MTKVHYSYYTISYYTLILVTTGFAYSSLAQSNVTVSYLFYHCPHHFPPLLLHSILRLCQVACKHQIVTDYNYQCTVESHNYAPSCTNPPALLAHRQFHPPPP